MLIAGIGFGIYRHNALQQFEDERRRKSRLNEQNIVGLEFEDTADDGENGPSSYDPTGSPDSQSPDQTEPTEHPVYGPNESPELPPPSLMGRSTTLPPSDMPDSRNLYQLV
jgi:hypothetical protein